MEMPCFFENPGHVFDHSKCPPPPQRRTLWKASLSARHFSNKASLPKSLRNTHLLKHGTLKCGYYHFSSFAIDIAWNRQPTISFFRVQFIPKGEHIPSPWARTSYDLKSSSQVVTIAGAREIQILLFLLPLLAQLESITLQLGEERKGQTGRTNYSAHGCTATEWYIINIY